MCRGAGATDDAAVLFHGHRRALPPGSDAFDVQRDTDAGEPAVAARRCLLAARLVHTTECERRVERALVIPGVVDEAERRRVRKVVLRDEVLAPQLDGIDVELARGDVHEAFEHERSLRAARASVRPGRDLRRCNAENLDLGGGNPVAAGQQLGRRQRGDRRGRVEIRAQVGEVTRADREHAAVFVERKLGIDVRAASLICGEHVLGARLRPVDRPAETECAQPDQRGLRARHALAAERAADVRDDDPQLVGRAPQHFRQSIQLTVLVLRGDPDRQEIGGAIVRRQRAARLERRGDEPRDPNSPAHDVSGARKRSLHVALRSVPPHEHVVRGLVVQDGLAAQRVFGLEHRG